MQHDQLLDTLGLICPEPVMLIRKKMREMNVNEVLKVIADDPSTTRDIPKFCLFMHHELLSNQVNDGQFIYYIKKLV